MNPVMDSNKQQLVISDANTTLLPKVVLEGQPLAKITTRGFEAPVLSGQKSRRPSSIGIIAEALYGTSTRRSRSVSRTRPASVVVDRPDQTHQFQYIPGRGYIRLPFSDLPGSPRESTSAQSQVLQVPVQATVSGGAVAAIDSTAARIQKNRHAFEEVTAASAVGPQSVLFHVCSTCGRRRSPQYHHNHPIAPGTTPLSGACRKCHNEYTSSEGTVEDDRSRQYHRRRKYGKYRRKKHEKKPSRPRFTNHSSSTDFESTLSEDSVFIDRDRRRTSRGRSKLPSRDCEEYAILDRSVSRGRRNSGLSIRVNDRSNGGISRERSANSSSIHLTVEDHGRDRLSDSSSSRWTISSPVSSICPSQHCNIHLEYHGSNIPETDQLVRPMEESHMYRPAEEYMLVDSRSRPVHRDTYRPRSISRSNRSHYHVDTHDHEHKYDHAQCEHQHPIARRRSQSLCSYVPTPYPVRKSQHFDREDGVYSGHIHDHDQHGYNEKEEPNHRSLRDRLHVLKDSSDEPVRQDSWDSTTVNVGGNRVSFRPEVSGSTLFPVSRIHHTRTRYRPSRDHSQTFEADDEYDSPSDISTEQRSYSPHRLRTAFRRPASPGHQYLTSTAASTAGIADSDTGLEAAFEQARLSRRTRVPSRSPSYVSRTRLRSRPQSPASTTLSYRSRRAGSPSLISYDRGRSQVRFEHASPPRRVPGAYGDELDDITTVGGKKRVMVVAADEPRGLRGEEWIRSSAGRAGERARKRIVSWQRGGGQDDDF